MTQSDSTSAAEADRSFLKSLGWASPRLVDTTLAALPLDSLPADAAQRRQWLLYAVLQQASDSRTLGAVAWANDERAEDYLNAVAAGTLPSEFSDANRWLKYLPWNRAQKHARRRRLLKRRCHDIHRPELPRPEAAAEHADELAGVQRMLTGREWSLLIRVTVDGYAIVAAEERIPVGTLKSQLSRCRSRVRQAC